MAAPEPLRYHLVGAAGVGMSALAEALLGQGMRVSASDRYVDTGQNLPVIRQLAAAGVAWAPQDGRGVEAGIRAVVVSTAIEPDNPDLVTARRLGVPVQHRSAVLAELAARGRCAAVAGTSGKSTVTGMTGWILEQCGLDPNVVSGAPVRQWMRADATGSVRVGQSDLWVIEADESDRSLLAYTPEWAVITNQSADHFTLAETELLFAEFTHRVRRSALGVGAAADYLDGFAPRVEAGRSRFSFRGTPCEVNLPGRHNAEDGLHALALCEVLGVPVADGAAALAGFKGVYRRLEPVWQGAGWAVYDDYAHNPAKIAAAWRALAPYYERMVAIWRPHGYGPLRAMAAELSETFTSLARPADRLVILPVYDAGGTADRSVQSDALAATLVERGVAAVYAPDDAAVRRAVRQAVWSRSLVVLTLGARDPGLPGLARTIGQELSAVQAELRTPSYRALLCL